MDELPRFELRDGKCALLHTEQVDGNQVTVEHQLSNATAKRLMMELLDVLMEITKGV